MPHTLKAGQKVYFGLYGNPENLEADLLEPYFTNIHEEIQAWA